MTNRVDVGRLRGMMIGRGGAELPRCFLALQTGLSGLCVGRQVG